MPTVNVRSRGRDLRVRVASVVGGSRAAAAVRRSGGRVVGRVIRGAVVCLVVKLDRKNEGTAVRNTR